MSGRRGSGALSKKRRKSGRKGSRSPGAKKGKWMRPVSADADHPSTSQQVAMIEEYGLDDLVLEDVKFHLASIERWFYQALTQRFARIKVPLRRLSLIFTDKGPCYQLFVLDKKGTTIASYLMSKAAGPSPTMNAQFSRLFHNHFQAITVTALAKSNLYDMVEKLLKATTEAGNVMSKPQPLHISRFSLNADCVSFKSKEKAKCLAALIDQLAPTIRHLQIEEEGSLAFVRYAWLPRTLKSIGGCHQLRSIDLLGLDITDRQTVVSMVCSLPNLHTLRFIDWTEMTSGILLPMPAPRRSLSLSTYWLPVMAHFNRELLKHRLGKVDHFTFYYGFDSRTLGVNDNNHMELIVSSMRSLPVTCRKATILVCCQMHQGPPGTPVLSFLHYWVMLAERYRVELSIVLPIACPTLPDMFASFTPELALTVATIPGLDWVLPRPCIAGMAFPLFLKCPNGAEFCLEYNDDLLVSDPSDSE